MNEKFFIICPIGLEKILQKELELKWSLHFPEKSYELIHKLPGGIEILAPVQEALRLNQILKTANRILLRIKEQKCRDLPKLYKIIKRINWKDYLNQEQIDFSVTASKSRLIHTTKIEKSAMDAVFDYFSANQISRKIKENYAENLPPKIFLRLSDDILQISLDTTGELLYIRGNESFRGHAPIRATMAQALLIQLLGFKSNYKDHTLIDPMCGTGTFLKEAQSFMKLNSSRSFAYQNFSKTIFKDDIKLLDKDDLWNFKEYLGFDLDSEVIKKNTQNESSIVFKNTDIFSTTDAITNQKVVIIVNPPYGKRVKISGNKKDFFQKIISQIQKKFSYTKLGIIIPKEYSPKIKAKDQLEFNQNGIKVNFFTLN